MCAMRPFLPVFCRNMRACGTCRFSDLIRVLKESAYLGSKKVDELVTSTQNRLNAETGEVESLDPGTVDNKWTRLALAVKCD